jgi:hypothetical protein
MQEVMASLGVATVGELAAVPMSKLAAQLGQETASWLARLAQVRVPMYVCMYVRVCVWVGGQSSKHTASNTLTPHMSGGFTVSMLRKL